MPGAIDNGYRWVLRPLLFRLPPERAQAVADYVLARRALSTVLGSGMQVRNGRLFVDLCGVTLENPVGLAAGYDKNCEMVGGLSRLGFGYLTVGTVTESPRPGNDAPRLLRLPKEESLLNALGFPGAGLEAAATALERSRDAAGGALLIVSVAGTTVDEFVRCHRRLEPLVDAIELNVSSPNTSGLRVFQEPEALGRLIGEINDGREKPLLVKLPWCGVSGDGEGGAAEERERLAALARVSVDAGVDALTVANTRPTADDRLSTGAGGLSGRGVFEDMLAMVAHVRSEAGDGVAINACGGIFSGEDAWRALQAGATTVQLFTGMVYRGPGIARMISQELLKIMDREGVDAFMYALEPGTANRRA
jgi:dihydroorotate dehydrogenase